MNIAYLKAKDDPLAESWIPADYPTQCREIGDETSYQKEPGEWNVVSADEYNALKENLKGQYESSLPPIDEPVPTPSIEDRIAALEGRADVIEAGVNQIAVASSIELAQPIGKIKIGG